MEILISMGIMLTVIGMSLGFFLETGRMNFVSAEKNDINRDVRNVIDRMASEGKQSNSFVIYTSTAKEDRDDSTDRVRTNESGDCLLLIFKSGYADMDDLGVDPLHSPRPITRLVLYYRSTTMKENGKSWGPVRRWEKDFSDDPITDPDSIRNIEDLLPSMATLNAESTNVVQLSEGLADGRLFYNFKNRTVMINGKIIHGNQAKWVTDTYNFSISPRG